MLRNSYKERTDNITKLIPYFHLEITCYNFISLEITCPHPGRPKFGSSTNLGKYTVGKKVTFECNDGYILNGVKYTVCESSGRFADPVPTCKRKIFIKNSMVYITICTELYIVLT